MPPHTFHLRGDLAYYIKAVPPFDWESMLFDCVSFLYGEEQPVRVILAGAIFEVSSDHYRPAPEETLSRRLIKGYYEAEDAMLKAVSEGDADKALRCKSSLRNTQKQD